MSGPRCECSGACGIHQRRCLEKEGEFGIYQSKGRIIYLVAIRDHEGTLRAVCPRCAAGIRKKRKLVREDAQPGLFDMEKGA